MSVKNVLFGKVDLDTIATALVMGVNPIEQAFVAIAGSAPGVQLSSKETLCIEVGGSGRRSENNFDHHAPATALAGVQSLSAAAQALERMARIVRYVDDVDCGRLQKLGEPGFPSLLQLISGMLLVVKKPEEQMKHGLVILREVMHSGVDPYGCMEPILDDIPHARWWAAQKREHERHFAEACDAARWFVTAAGRKLAVVETTWIGAPGALQGYGADVVVALNPQHEVAGGRTTRKFTIAGKAEKVSVLPALMELDRCEPGWGGPAHGTIGGSPIKDGSALSMEEVLEVVVRTL